MRAIVVVVTVCVTLVSCNTSGSGDGGADTAARDFAATCPTAEDIGSRLGQEVEFEDVVSSAVGAELECTYFIGPLAGDGAVLVMAWRLPPDRAAELNTDYLIGSYAPRSVFGDPEPFELGDEGLVSRFDSDERDGLYGHDAFAIVPAGDRACLGSYASIVSAPEPRRDLDDTFNYILGSLCGE